MRKAIAALLSMFVGLFGYAIVDDAMESRVANLESVVSSQQNEIDSLHGLNSYSHTTTAFTGTTADTSTYRETITTKVNSYYSAKTKFMFRLYSDGYIAYIPSGTATITTRRYYTTTRASVTTTTAFPEEYREYFAYITDSSCVLSSKETQTRIYTYYNSDYTMCSTVSSCDNFHLTLTVKGYTDKVFAGKCISIQVKIGEGDSESSYVTCKGTIADDGTFNVQDSVTRSYFFQEDLYAYAMKIS
jgi:hypothetical protein